MGSQYNPLKSALSYSRIIWVQALKKYEYTQAYLNSAPKKKKNLHMFIYLYHALNLKVALKTHSYTGFTVQWR